MARKLYQAGDNQEGWPGEGEEGVGDKSGSVTEEIKTDKYDSDGSNGVVRALAGGVNFIHYPKGSTRDSSWPRI